jgi:hypothetical protein
MTVPEVPDIHPPVSSAQFRAGLDLTFAIAEAIREAGEIPSGTLYALVLGKVDYDGYQKLLGILKGAGLIQVMPSHMVKWVGPDIRAKVVSILG